MRGLYNRPVRAPLPEATPSMMDAARASLRAQRRDRKEVLLPELPDIVVLARSLDAALRGRTVASVTVNQPKCLNVTPEALAEAIAGQRFERAWQRGKWALLDLAGALLALNLGMGGEVRLHAAGETPDPARERVVLRFQDEEQLWVHFWWFGQLHLVPHGDPARHPQLGRLGAEPLADDFAVECLAGLLRGRRGALKKYLLDQTVIAGIGNVYVQDILWYARLHPLRTAGSLAPEELQRLHAAIRLVLQEGIRWGGGPGEQDVWGQRGAYEEHLQVGYRTGRPCPARGAPVEELRVGATTSYLCPRCQPQGTAGGSPAGG